MLFCLMSHDRGLPALHRPNISQTLLHNLCVGSGGLHNWFTGMCCLETWPNMCQSCDHNHTFYTLFEVLPFSRWSCVMSCVLATQCLTLALKSSISLSRAAQIRANWFMTASLTLTWASDTVSWTWAIHFSWKRILMMVTQTKARQKKGLDGFCRTVTGSHEGHRVQRDPADPHWCCRVNSTSLETSNRVTHMTTTLCSKILLLQHKIHFHVWI